MTNGDYIRSCTDCGMAKEILRIARGICENCCYTSCEGIDNCEWFSERWGSPDLAEYLSYERKEKGAK